MDIDDFMKMIPVKVYLFITYPLWPLIFYNLSVHRSIELEKKIDYIMWLMYWFLIQDDYEFFNETLTYAKIVYTSHIGAEYPLK